MSRARAPRPLVQAASALYRDAGPFAWRFARGKLTHDPVFTSILARGLLRGPVRLLDLGCGQGLLGAWLKTAQALYARGASGRDGLSSNDRPGSWPEDWPPPPALAGYTGIDSDARSVARARRALTPAEPGSMRIVAADIRDVDYPPADAVVLLDVLHYLDYSAQERVLARARRALVPGGVLLLRIGDAAGGFGFTLSKAVDRVVVLARLGSWQRLFCRRLEEWRALLARDGWRSDALPMSDGTPFPNVLLRAEAT